MQKLFFFNIIQSSSGHPVQTPINSIVRENVACFHFRDIIIPSSHTVSVSSNDINLYLFPRTFSPAHKYINPALNNPINAQTQIFRRYDTRRFFPIFFFILLFFFFFSYSREQTTSSRISIVCFSPSFRRSNPRRLVDTVRRAGFITRLNNAPTAKRENNAKARRLYRAVTIRKQINRRCVVIKTNRAAAGGGGEGERNHE